MKKKKLEDNLFYRSRYIFASFLMAAFIMLIIYLVTGVYPFGENSVLRMDLYHQYGPLFAELLDRIKSGQGFSYSWVSGLGSSFLGNYFNYLSSPIAALIVFFSHDHVLEAIALMILIKAALSAASFTWYLKKSQHNHSPATAAFGVLYAYCGYMLAYYWNVMWLDAMVLLPVVLLGIERIIDNGKIWTYLIGLALTFFSNYYMSYMMCLFAVIYFFYYFITNYHHGAVLDTAARGRGLIRKLKNSRFFRSGVLFAFASFTAAGLIAFALLPTYNILKTASATSGTFPTEIKTYFKFFDFLANHFNLITTTIRSSGDDVLPNVYCGLLTVILAPLFFFTKSISKKEKLTTLGLLAIFYVSFNLNIFNYIWHGMHFPNDLPYRFSFMYSFILLLMAYKTFIRLNEFTSRQIGIVGAALVAFVFITEKVTSKNVNAGTVYLTLIFAVIYVLLLTIFKDKRYEIGSLAVLMCVVVCSEAIICDTMAFTNDVNRASYISDYKDFRELKGKLDTIEQGNFYRMELTNLRARMDNCWYGYNGASTFTSMAYESLSRLENRLGMMSNNINSFTYNPQTPVYNMMHSLKYIVNNETPNVLSNKYYKEIDTVDKFQAYSNKYYLPIAFCTDTNLKSWDYGGDEKNIQVNPFQVQGDFFSKATGEKDPFVKVPISYVTYTNIEPFTEDLDLNVFHYQKTNTDDDASAVFSVTAQNKGNIYIYYRVDGADSKDITVNSKIGTISQNAGQDCILDLGRYERDDTLTITVPFEQESGQVTLYIYTIDDEVLDEGYNRLSLESMQITKFENTVIEGKITAINDRLMFTSIPYDEGWTVYVDGKQVKKDDIVSLGNAFLAVNLKKGTHEIKFEYEPAGLMTGIKISAVCLIILIAYIMFVIIKKRSKKGYKMPVFAPMNCAYNEDVFMQKSEKRLPAQRKIGYRYGMPEREIIMPQNMLLHQNVQKEIIVPQNKFTITDIDVRNGNPKGAEQTAGENSSDNEGGNKGSITNFVGFRISDISPPAHIKQL